MGQTSQGVRLIKKYPNRRLYDTATSSYITLADVKRLVLENADGLLPVDYATVEVGRRLFRSGENEYLVNRQRVRLLREQASMDSEYLAGVLSRHGLEATWKQWTP